MNNIHTRIKALRKRYNYTQEYVGSILDISQQSYSIYEMNKQELPARHVVRLAKLYHVSTDYILGMGEETAEHIPPDAEYVKDLSYQQLLNRLQKLNTIQRENVFSYLLFLQNGGPSK